MILLPVPRKVEEKDGVLMLGMDTMIVMESGCPQGAYTYAGQLQEEAKTYAGLTLGINRGCLRSGDIGLGMDASLKEQQYTLNITQKGAELKGGSLQALGYAVQTLRQILRQCAGLLPCVEIADEPDLYNRGFYHDATRGRIQTLDNLKRLADTMCFYKMNQLQLYVEHTHLYRDLTELWRDDTPLTAAEILELDQYCYDRGIELVPSIATFGHLYKLLSTRSHEQLCELPDSAGKAFSFRDRMGHHTVNVSNPEALALIKDMMEEYMALFRTDKFNICADETFDLGKGRSQELAREKGTGVLYLEYIKELFDFLIERGKVPMFWGDIISGHPELYDRIPGQVVCLTWGYSENQSDREARILYEAGARQYLCPGTRGWNTWLNMMWGSYENVRKMCEYARKYKAIGVLNTDWGDFGHINHPLFSIPGLIYGAVFSWGENVPAYEELSRQISVLEYGDVSGRLVDFWDQVNRQTAFSWHHAVTIKEWAGQGMDREQIRKFFEEEDMTGVPKRKKRLEELEVELRQISRSLDSRSRSLVQPTHVAIEMVLLWNEVGAQLTHLEEPGGREQRLALASRLERCLHYYQELWRSNSKEGDLGKITDVFCWYADVLRR